jgi:predicted PurR-regulated permease PerM
VLLGVLGGLKLFGFIGLILGPVLLGVLLAVMRIYNLETEKYRKS